MKTTHIWISWNGTKTPIHLMNNEYLKNAYIRCLEVMVAERYKARKVIFNAVDNIKSEMDSKILTLEKANKWIVYFKEEFEKRKLKLPTEKDIDLKFREKQIRKEFKRESNKRFNDQFR